MDVFIGGGMSAFEGVPISRLLGVPADAEPSPTKPRQCNQTFGENCYGPTGVVGLSPCCDSAR